MAILQDISDVQHALTTYNTIAVIGAHINPAKPAHYVPKYMYDHGYTILPVNAGYAGRMLFGQPVTASLAEAAEYVEHIDVVNVFRRSEHVAVHLEEILALSPKLVWLQLGIRNDEVAKTLSEAGIDVIQDRCMLADHRALLAS